MIDSRLSGKSISEMIENELRVMTDQIILRCSAITGCEIPTLESYAEHLSEELVLFLIEEGYGDLTSDEIALAMRLNCRHNLKNPTGVEGELVEFTGTFVNILFMSKILYNYIQRRKLLDGKFRNLIEGQIR